MEHDLTPEARAAARLPYGLVIVSGEDRDNRYELMSKLIDCSREDLSRESLVLDFEEPVPEPDNSLVKQILTARESGITRFDDITDPVTAKITVDLALAGTLVFASVEARSPWLGVVKFMDLSRPVSSGVFGDAFRLAIQPSTGRWADETIVDSYYRQVVSPVLSQA